MNISNRALELKGPSSPIVEGHMTCASDPFVPKDNQTGYLNFGTAENYLVNDLLLPKLNEKIEIQKEHIQYNQLNGMEEVRNTISTFLENHLNISKVDPEHIIIQTGVSAICESLSFALFDEGDEILIPAPYYTGFDHDFNKRFKIKFRKAYLDPNLDFKHQIEAFKNAYLEGYKKAKAILITHPHNPTGEILDESFFQEIIEFCKEENLHLISDEIYALSTFKNKDHSSLYQVAKEAGVKTHLLYGMAKDFCLAGMKVGFFYSEDLELSQTMKNLCYFHPVSTQTQLLVKNILDDKDFVSSFVIENNKRLAKTYSSITSGLKNFKIIPSESGLFFMIDLSNICPSFEKELELFNTLLNNYKINMTPGKELGLNKPGFFRVCFAKDEESIKEFLSRMEKFSLEYFPAN